MIRSRVIRKRGLSVRLKLTLSYAGLLLLAGGLLLAVVWVFLLRYVPPDAIVADGGIRPGRTDLIEAFTPRVTQALVFLLVFGLLGGWLLAGRMLAPLRRITIATRKAAAGSLSHRINMPGRSDEFRELADSFDSMLGRIEAHVAEQQRFAANASHELRTPLAITRTVLDVAESDPEVDTAELIRRLKEVNTRAINLTEALLLLSRADQRAFQHEQLDLSLLTEEAAETLLPLAERHGHDINTRGEYAPARGSKALLLQLVMNLIHNAIVHNKPGGGTIRVHTELEGGQAVLSVENSGEHVAQDMLATLAEPFRRGTERIHSDQTGAGLGLAIVKSITEAHDGTLEFSPRSGGGLSVTVRLPAAMPGA